MSLIDYAKKAVGYASNPLLYQGKKALEALTPKGYEGGINPEDNVTIQPFDVGDITRGLKQTQAVTGRAITPEAITAATKGAIEAQIVPAQQAAERERERALDIQKYNLKAKKEAEAARVAGAAGIGQFAGSLIGLGMGGPGGAMVGGSIGGGAGGILGGSSVLCTELRRQEIMSDRLVLYATLYRIKHVDIAAYEGYLMWAKPLVILMKKSSLITKLVSFVWVPVTIEMASRVSPKMKGNKFGKVSYFILSKFSRTVNKLWRLRWHSISKPLDVQAL